METYTGAMVQGKCLTYLLEFKYTLSLSNQEIAQAFGITTQQVSWYSLPCPETGAQTSSISASYILTNYDKQGNVEDVQHFRNLCRSRRIYVGGLKNIIWGKYRTMAIGTAKRTNETPIQSIQAISKSLTN